MTSAPRIWVIDPSVAHPETQGIGEVLRDWDGAVRLFQPCLEPGDGPRPGTGYDTDGVVLLGSAASVYDDPPWMASLGEWLLPLLRGTPRIPVLGVCFGHQLIAHLAGGRIGFLREDRSKLLGVSTTRLASNRLLEGQQDLRVVVSHREEVQQVPSGYRVIAHRESSALDGLEHETLPVFSFQFHPEAREEFAASAGFDPAAIEVWHAGTASDCWGRFAIWFAFEISSPEKE